MPALLTSETVDLETHDGRRWHLPDPSNDKPVRATAQVRPLSGLDYARVMPMDLPEQLVTVLAKGLVTFNGTAAPAKPAEEIAWGPAHGLYDAIVDVSLGNTPGAPSSSTGAPALESDSTSASQS